MSVIKVVLLFVNDFFSKKIQLISDIENYFENQNCAIFDLPFQIDPNT